MLTDGVTNSLCPLQSAGKSLTHPPSVCKLPAPPSFRTANRTRDNPRPSSFGLGAMGGVPEYREVAVPRRAATHAVSTSGHPKANARNRHGAV